MYIGVQNLVTTKPDQQCPCSFKVRGKRVQCPKGLAPTHVFSVHYDIVNCHMYTPSGPTLVDVTLKMNVVGRLDIADRF